MSVIGEHRAKDYPWLTVRVEEDGVHWEIDMEGTLPAEADRRMVIMQELRAGRVFLREEAQRALRLAVEQVEANSSLDVEDVFAAALVALR